MNVKGGTQRMRGSAVFAVLVVLALALIALLLFLAAGLSERRKTQLEVATLNSAKLAEEATQIVISQIQSASCREASGWASQPGILRTWDADGEFSRGFKLYSDERMVEADEKRLTASDFAELESGWENRPWQFVDLNEPVRKNGNPHFPVVTPDARDFQGIEGFDFNHEDSEYQLESSLNPLPMPVKWIYRLRNGQLGVLDANRRFVPSDGESKPGPDNPIVGRFAFWTDDESCRLNPTVHAGGTAWETPLAGGDFDRRLAGLAPAGNEWQRYSGHPATTSLGPVFAPDEPELFQQPEIMKQLYALVPRVVGGGSADGTRHPDHRGLEPNGLVADQDSIPASHDEIFLNPDRKLKELSEIGGDAIIDISRFFLSVHSHAPEVTFDGKPRISIWPTRAASGSDSEEFWTIHDRLIRFAAEIGTDSEGGRARYHFERMNADSPTADFDQIARNRELFHWLETHLSANIQGLGKSFSTKYTKAERRQILTQIFDSIRSTNLHDDNLYTDWEDAFALAKENTSQHSTFTNGRAKADSPVFSLEAGGMQPGFGQVTPIQIKHKDGSNSRGFGRFFTFQEMGVQVIACADGGDGTGGGAWVPADPGSLERPVQPPSGQRFSNFPPLPLSVKREDESTWPTWMSDLKSDTPELVDKAFDPANWNWQLAWLDPAYEQAMPQRKFDRSALQDAGITRLKAGERLVQAGLIWSMTCPSLVRTGVQPDFLIDFEIQGMDFKNLAGERMAIGWRHKPTFGAAGPGTTHWATNHTPPGSSANGFHGGIYLPSFFLKTSHHRDTEAALELEMTGGAYFPKGRLTPLDRDFDGAEPYHRYHYVTRPFRVAESVSMDAGTVKARIFTGGSNAIWTENGASQNSKPVPVQDLEFAFESFELSPPALATGRPRTQETTFDPPVGPMAMWSLGWDGANPEISSVGRPGLLENRTEPLMDSSDLVQSVGITSGDGRLVASKRHVRVADGLFTAHRDYGEKPMAHAFQSASGWKLPGATSTAEQRVYSGSLAYPAFQNDGSPFLRTPDFDTGLYLNAPGAWINKPDEGNGHFLNAKTPTRSHFEELGMIGPGRDLFHRQHWNSYGESIAIPAYFTPNRIVTSPGIFGSLPVGTTENEPWRTLLFRPSTDETNPHPGAATDTAPADHRLLDLFWMPVVEPWAISETFSTRGKVNLNYQILPFRHIQRDTALRGVFQSTTMLCVPNTKKADHKAGFGRGRGYHWRDNPYGGNLQGINLRAAIAPNETLAQFESKFNDPENPTLFRTASEICDVHLIPTEYNQKPGARKSGTYQPTLDQMKSGRYWSDHAAVGDDARERPYSQIYPRVTTRSNVYRIYIHAQVVEQAHRETPEDYELWDPETDTVKASRQCSKIIERHLDPDHPDIPDYATAEDPVPSLDHFYRYRILMETPFTP